MDDKTNELREILRNIRLSKNMTRHELSILSGIPEPTMRSKFRVVFERNSCRSLPQNWTNQKYTLLQM